MSLHRRDPRRDANERPIIETLEARGYSVFQISGAGISDLIASKQGSCWLIEVKRRKGKLTPAQIAFRTRWTGPAIRVLRSAEEAWTFPTCELA